MTPILEKKINYLKHSEKTLTTGPKEHLIRSGDLPGGLRGHAPRTMGHSSCCEPPPGWAIREKNCPQKHENGI